MKILKILVWVIAFSVALFPISYGLTSPEYLGWVFYTDMTLIFGSMTIAIAIMVNKLIK